MEYFLICVFYDIVLTCNIFYSLWLVLALILIFVFRYVIESNPLHTTLLIYHMPQALPFYFVSQAVFVMFTLAVLVYLVSVYLLPPYLQLFVTRTYVTKL